MPKGKAQLEKILILQKIQTLFDIVLPCIGVHIIKVCRRTSEDLSVFVVFLIIFILSYFSLQQIFSNDFSVISQPISIKFGRFIVLDETKSLNIISSQ